MKITAKDIRKALLNVYQSPEWYLGFEVGNSTGASCRRQADAVAINAYPSKGFETRGFEIKVSKGDLKAELNLGIKSDEIARFCDYWFLVVPKGLADEFTLPPTWGVIEYREDGTLRQKVKPQRLEKIAPTPGFLCAMLRARERLIEARAVELEADRIEQLKGYILDESKNYEKELKELRGKLKEVKTSTGIQLDSWTPTELVIKRLKSVQDFNLIVNSIRSIERVTSILQRDCGEVQQAVSSIISAEGSDGLRDRILEFPCKQYQEVFYIHEDKIHKGWYLSKVGKTSHIILVDVDKQDIVWVTDGMWSLNPEILNKENGLC